MPDRAIRRAAGATNGGAACGVPPVGTRFPGAEAGSSPTFSEVYGNDIEAVIQGQQAQSWFLA